MKESERFRFEDMGIAIYDDVAANMGPFVGPTNYERIFLPSLKRMVRAYKQAGAARVMHQSDGNVLPLLDYTFFRPPRGTAILSPLIPSDLISLSRRWTIHSRTRF
jgi:hypothetical protein